MTRLRLAAATLAATLALACTKQPGPASPDFAKARQDYLNLLNKDGPSDVYTDPALSPIRAQLDKVPADSIDADAAHALAATIDKGIAEAKTAAADRAKAVAETTQPATVVLPAAPPEPAAPQPTAPAAPQPSAQAPEGPSTGMSAQDFRAKYSGCFDKEATFKDDQGHAGDTYVLSAGCATKYPSFKDQLVLLTVEKIVGIVPRTAIQNQQSFQVQSSKQQEQPPPPPQPVQPPPVYGETPAPPPPNPNTIDQGVKGADSQVKAPSNLNSDLDQRTKLPGQP